MANRTIAIIGATEPAGVIISKSFAKRNRLLLFSRNNKELKALVKEIKKFDSEADLESFECLVNASWEADIIVFLVPSDDEKSVAEKIRQVATQKIVIELIDHMDVTPDAQDDRYTGRRNVLQQWLPHSKMVQVRLLAGSSPHHVAGRSLMDVLVRGTNIEAVETVKDIFVKAGFDVSESLTTANA